MSLILMHCKECKFYNSKFNMCTNTESENFTYCVGDTDLSCEDFVMSVELGDTISSVESRIIDDIESDSPNDLNNITCNIINSYVEAELSEYGYDILNKNNKYDISSLMIDDKKVHMPLWMFMEIFGTYVNGHAVVKDNIIVCLK